MKFLVVSLFLVVIAVNAAPPAPPPGGYPDGFLSKECEIPKCTESNVALQHPLDCLLYISCDENKVAREVACPPDLHFNKVKGICEDQTRAKCKVCYQ